MTTTKLHKHTIHLSNMMELVAGELYETPMGFAPMYLGYDVSYYGSMRFHFLLGNEVIVFEDRDLYLLVRKT